jgi:tetratricopeptide (TPR) repeat protein
MNHFGLGTSLLFARRYGEAIRALTDAEALIPEDVAVNMWLGIAYYLNGDFQSAGTACERAGEVNGPWCLAMIYDKLGRHTEAETMLAKVGRYCPRARLARDGDAEPGPVSRVHES